MCKWWDSWRYLWAICVIVVITNVKWLDVYVCTALYVYLTGLWLGVYDKAVYTRDLGAILSI